MRAGLDVIAVPTSEATRAQAEQCGIPLTTLDETPELDLTIDGADEIGPDLALIKGGGGGAAAREDRRGGLGPHGGDRRRLEMGRDARRVSAADRGRAVRPRCDPARGRSRDGGLGLSGAPDAANRDKAGLAFVTDGGHFILDAALRRIADPRLLAARLAAIPGVVEHGLFIGLAQTAVVAGPNGRRIIERA